MGLAASKIRVAAIGDDAPGGGQFVGPALSGMPAAAGNGWVVFRSRVTGGATAEQIVVTNLAAGQEQRFVVAAVGQPVGKVRSEDAGTFKQFLGRPSVNANGDVAFVATLTNSDLLPGGIDNLGAPTPAGVFLFLPSAAPNNRLRLVALARDPVDGDPDRQLDLATAVGLSLESTSLDLLERTPALNDAGDVAFTAFIAGQSTGVADSAAIFLAPSGGDAAPVIRLDAPFEDERFSFFGPPALNNLGAIAFRAGTVDENDRELEGVFVAAGGTIARVIRAGDTIARADDPDNVQQPFDFGDLIVMNDAGDVAFSAGGLIDLATFTSLDLENGVIVFHAGALSLVTYPGKATLADGRMRGGNLGPDGGNDVAPPGLTADGRVFAMAELTGGNGIGLFSATPPNYDARVASIIFGGTNPTPSPLGGVYFGASSGPAVDATGNVTFFTRLANGPSSEALVFRPVGGNANAILIGDATPAKGFFGGPPFSAPVLTDDDQVVFKAFVANGPSALGIFRWRRADPEDARLTHVVRAGDVAPVEDAPPFLDLPGDPSVNAHGVMAFAGLVQGRGRGVFTHDPVAGLRKVALPDEFLPPLLVLPPTPIESIFESVAANPLMMDDGGVVFRATFSYQDPLNFFNLVREEGVFRAAPDGTLSLLVRTSQDSPTGTPYFRFRDPSTSGGGLVVFRAPLGARDTSTLPDLLPVGLFLIDPTAAVTTVAMEDQDVGGLILRGLAGRPAVDAVGTVAFLGRTGTNSTALVRRSPDGSFAVLARVDGPGPEGGFYRALSRPAMSANGHVAFRGGFDRTPGGTSGFFLAGDSDTPRPFVQVGEGDADGDGGRLSSVNPSASLNSSDHLAFIASTTAGKTRNGIFLASPTSTVVERVTVRVHEPRGNALFGKVSVRGQATLTRGDIGRFSLGSDSVAITISDAAGVLYSVTLGKKALVRNGRVWVPKKRISSLRALALRRLGKDRVRISFRSGRVDYLGDFVRPPIKVRLDVGANGGSSTIDCVTDPRGAVCR